MRVTYLQHSGFLVEWEDIACLFDWVEGELPAIEAGKKLFVFVSHVHSDHFTPELFTRCQKYSPRTFVFSSDIKATPEKGDTAAVVRIPANLRRIIPGGGKGTLSVTTLRSTDCGVAFVVNYAGVTVYHAGDLHWWAWPDDTPEEERTMRNRFAAEMVKLRGLTLDAAFLPLDPRLEDNFWMGFDALMRSAHVKMAFPMHMWEKYEYIDKLRQLQIAAPYRDRIAEITAPGQVFELT